MPPRCGAAPSARPPPLGNGRPRTRSECVARGAFVFRECVGCNSAWVCARRAKPDAAQHAMHESGVGFGHVSDCREMARKCARDKLRDAILHWRRRAPAIAGTTGRPEPSPPPPASRTDATRLRTSALPVALGPAAGQRRQTRSAALALLARTAGSCVSAVALLAPTAASDKPSAMAARRSITFNAKRMYDLAGECRSGVRERAGPTTAASPHATNLDACRPTPSPPAQASLSLPALPLLHPWPPTLG